MGSIASVGSTLLSAVNIANPARDTVNNLKEIDLKNQQLAAQANIQKQKNLFDFQTNETDRQNKLRRAISTQRANFGSQGVGSVTGSGDSVLQGINENSDITRQQNETKLGLDNTAIDQNYQTQRQLNLLQKQQLKQKSVLGYLNDIF
jgi:hypothetical protein